MRNINLKLFFPSLIICRPVRLRCPLRNQRHSQQFQRRQHDEQCDTGESI